MESLEENLIKDENATKLQKANEKIESLTAMIDHADIKRTLPTLSKQQEIRIKAMNSQHIPVVLQPIWESEEVRLSYRALKKEHQRLLREYLENGFDAQAAYKVVYKTEDKNRPYIILRNVHINCILKHFNDTCEADRLLISKTYKEAMEAEKPIFGKDEHGQPCLIQQDPDHKIRIDASEKLAKLNGYIVDKSESKDKKSLTLNVLNAEVIGNLNQFLVQSGQNPIKPQKQEDEDSGAIGNVGMRVVE